MAEIPKAIAARALLRWYAEMGVDEAVERAPADFFAWTTPRADDAQAAADGPVRSADAQPTRPSTRIFSSADAAMPADEAAAEARAAARACDSFKALAEAVERFEGCPLKAGASKTVFADGTPASDLLVIGEAPGRDEDRIGKPFVGRAGQLLDRMLAVIGRSREKDVLISNVIFWRPPGNRTPTRVEIAVCRPFIDRLIEITAPKAVLLAGGAPTQALLGVSGIMRARGVWREIETASGARFPALPTFHPAFLLRQPGQKKLAWRDLLSLDARLRDG
ncbi:MAG: uracil-DNA glycosylase [Parvularculaceae bacterium]